MFLRSIRDSFQKKLVVCFETSDIHSFQLSRRGARERVQPQRISALCAGVFALLFAFSPASMSAGRVRGGHGGGDSTLGLSATSLAFGNVSLDTAKTLSLTLTSTGTGPLTVSAAAITGSGFTVSATTFPLKLSPNQTATMTVKFDPATAGAASGTLTITSNSSSGESKAITLSGTGVSTSVATLSVNATSIAFGDVSLNSPATQSITLSSTGSLPVVVSKSTVAGTGFAVSGITLPLTLNPSQTATLSAQFDPTAAGAASGTLTIVSTSITNPTDVVTLTGTGVADTYKVNLSWDAPSSSTDPVAGYNVYRAPNGSTSYELLNDSPVAQTDYADTTVEDGQTYDYYVKSVDASGNTSVASNMASVIVP